MKKTTMIAALIALCAIGASAVDVYSANVVGYTQVALSPGLNMLGAQFVQVGDEAAVNINDLLFTDDLAGLDQDLRFQTQLKTWTGIGYATYGWMADGDGTDNEMPEWDAKWILYDMSDIADIDIPAGEGFWIQTTDGATVTFSGQVITDDTEEIEVSAGLNMIANPFPTAISIQGIQSADLAGLDQDLRFQTQLKVWTGIGYATYGWMADGDGTANEMPEWDAKWILYDMSDLADVTIGIGTSFWIQTSDSATITFTK